MNTAEEIRSELATLGERTRGFKYPEGFCRRVAVHVRRCLSTGDHATSIAASLTIPWTTLSRWLESYPEGRSTSLVPVQLLEGTPVVSAVRGHSPLALVTPKGFRLEGLGLEQAAELLRRLG